MTPAPFFYQATRSKPVSEYTQGDQKKEVGQLMGDVAFRRVVDLQRPGWIRAQNEQTRGDAGLLKDVPYSSHSAPFFFER